MSNNSSILFQRVRQHFTPAELVDFLGVDFETLFDGELFAALMEDSEEELKEEIGYE